MTARWLLPIGLVLVGAGAWLGAKVSRRIDRTVTRVALAAFGGFVTPNVERERVIEAAFIEETYGVYAAKTFLFAAIGLLAGTAAGELLFAGLLQVVEPVVHALSGLPRTIAVPLGFTPDFTLVLSPGARWAIVVGGGLLTGLVLAVGAYVLRWKLPESDAEVRRRSIDEGLPRTTAFMYALSRGGMEFPAVLRILGRNRAVFGEAANETRVAAREMDVFGRDVLTAIRRMARRSPSERFKTFGENLASVLGSGSDLPSFLRDQYERFQEEAEERQEEILELLATIAEGYVTTLVAGVLFFITILLVFGLTTTDTLWALQIVGYLMIPLANAAFIVYLQGKLDALGIARESGGDVLDRLETRTPIRSLPAADDRRADGGHAATGDVQRQLGRYDHLKRVKRVVRRPLRTLVENPTTILYVTVPLALVLFAVRFPQATQSQSISIRVLDDLVVQSVLLVLLPYAVVRELYKRRIDRIEAAMPELVERLASLNEAGMTLTEAVERVRGGDLGVLSPEVDRIWRDVRFGSTIDDAFVRFGRRVRTTAVTRVVTLVIHAQRASGQLGDVLRITATQARADLRMRRQRSQEMLTYLIVIYVAFVVFLVIIFAVNEVLVPSLPESVPTPTSSEVNRLGVETDQFTRLGNVDKAAYSLIFFHTALVQAVCSGFVGGQLGEGSLRDGAKHAAVLLTVAYLAFVLLSAPVASVGGSNAVSTGEAITVPSASASEGGFVVAYDDGVNSTELGHSAYLPPGTHQDVLVPLDEPVRDNRTITLAVHRDTNGNEQLDFAAPYLPARSQIDGPYPPIADRGSPGVEVEVVYVGG